MMAEMQEEVDKLKDRVNKRRIYDGKMYCSKCRLLLPITDFSTKQQKNNESTCKTCSLANQLQSERLFKNRKKIMEVVNEIRDDISEKMQNDVDFEE